MSFRYTNNLIGALQHRLALESAHREIVRRTFIGTCNGIEVTCSGYGTVLAIKMMERATWGPFYSRNSSSINNGEKASLSSDAAATAAAADGDDSPSAELAAERAKEVAKEANNSSSNGLGGLDYTKLSDSIKTAAWEANRLIRSAKEEAHARSLLHNPHIRAAGNLRDWYEHDATSLHPRPFDALKQEAATPWIQAVRFAKANASEYLGRCPPPPISNDNSDNNSGSPSNNETTAAAPSSAVVSVLGPADCDPLAIPIGSTHPLYIASLTQIESTTTAAGGGGGVDGASAATGRPSLSHVDAQVVLSEQRREMSKEEQNFWERVEMIRKGQLASIPNAAAANKRGYAEMTTVVSDNVEDKVDLKFTQ